MVRLRRFVVNRGPAHRVKIGAEIWVYYHFSCLISIIMLVCMFMIRKRNTLYQISCISHQPMHLPSFIQKSTRALSNEGIRESHQKCRDLIFVAIIDNASVFTSSLVIWECLQYDIWYYMCSLQPPYYNANINKYCIPCTPTKILMTGLCSIRQTEPFSAHE